MNFLAQIILAARHNRDVEDTGWMQLLVFVVIAVIYAIGGIINKAKANKISRADDEKLEYTLAPSKQQHRRPIPQPKTKISVSQPARHTISTKEVEPPQESVTEPVKTSEEAEEHIFGVLSDYSNADSLKRAILHYEILSKPLALRETEESFNLNLAR